jgi:protein-tyrosine phosphatase
VAESAVGTLLFVCTANICRSPLAELHLGEALRGSAFEGASIGSAGVRGLTGAAMCEVAAEALDDPARAAGHEAREISRELIEQADLVLTMEKEQRGAVSRLAPGHQHKVYTLREAERLAAAVAEDRERPAPTTVAELAARMRALRGFVPIAPPEPEPPRRRFGFRRPAPVPVDDGLSIDDGHNIGPEEHVRTAQAVRETVERFAAAVREAAPSR